MKDILCSFSFCILCTIAFGQDTVLYKNPSMPIGDRIRDLQKRMTMEEKFWQLFMIPGTVNQGDEEKYINGIFGFQVSAESRSGDATQQMLNYNASDDALLLANKINGIQRYFIQKSRLGIPIIA